MPVVVGRKRTRIVQVEFTAIGPAVQVSLSLKSPVAITRLIVSEAAPVFVTVIVSEALDVATACSTKFRAVGFKEITGSTAVLAVSSGICQIPRP